MKGLVPQRTTHLQIETRALLSTECLLLRILWSTDSHSVNESGVIDWSASLGKA
jgi:hypothetical protein